MAPCTTQSKGKGGFVFTFVSLVKIIFHTNRSLLPIPIHMYIRQLSQNIHLHMHLLQREGGGERGARELLMCPIHLHMLPCIAVCCSVLQCAKVCCSCAVCCSGLIGLAAGI